MNTGCINLGFNYYNDPLGSFWVALRLKFFKTRKAVGK
jgi:hypothetical protein